MTIMHCTEISQIRMFLRLLRPYTLYMPELYMIVKEGSGSGYWHLENFRISVADTRYRVFHEESTSLDQITQELEKITLYLTSHSLLPHTPKTPLPSRYAKLAAERGQSYLHPLSHGFSDEDKLGDNVNSVNTVMDETYKEAERIWGKGPGQTMFYI
jgi:hypothetical protein